MFFNYFTPLYGIIKIWKYHSKVISLLLSSIWNILIFLPPKNTILGPIIILITKKNILYKFFVNWSICCKRRKKLLFLIVN